MKNKENGVFFGVVMIISALLIIASCVLSGMGYMASIPLVNLILGVLCVAWIFSVIVKRKPETVYFPIAFLFMLFEGEIATLIGAPDKDIISNWILLLCAVLLCIGTGALRSGKNRKEWKKFDKSWSKSQGTRYIDSTNLTNQLIENNMANSDVFFENAENYHGGATVAIDNNMAKMTIHVPSAWSVNATIENNIGSIYIPSTGNPDGKVLNIVGENNMGRVEILLI